MRLLSTSRILPRCWAIACLVVLSAVAAYAQEPSQSVARQWNEALLDAIREDFARPTVHARNLFHVSTAMFDAWAAYDVIAVPYLLNQPRGGTACDIGAVPSVSNPRAAQEEALSHAAYRVLRHRFLNSPGALDTLPALDALLVALGYDPSVTSTDVVSGQPAALGNAIAACVIAYGLADGANEPRGYANADYASVNPPLTPTEPGNPGLLDPDRWQPLRFEVFIDQSGNEIPGGTPDFIGPEWGRVRPFALQAADRIDYERDGATYPVYRDPGPPPLLAGNSEEADAYLWGFELVLAWSAHLDPSDGAMLDISPGTLGNLEALPTTEDEVRAFYDVLDGGDPSTGHAVNPHTGQPYASQRVPRGDYTRVLAEFWADGPDSETPPGHWFTILNSVNDDPRLERRFEGTGPLLDPLEWDVKAYFALGGAMHDVAVAVWGLKGWYDYIRPISAIRAMGDRGQRSDPSQPGYDPAGVALRPGLVEVIQAGDPLAGPTGEHVGKLKAWAWLGPDAIEDPATDTAGVGWIRIEDWWPYQRPTFITPPFAGYVSGHSTFSRAAAEVLTQLTGDPFFPGGLGSFQAPQNAFLVFEQGPSVDVDLQWATYRDAADQCALSRIWGGIHPPADDLPGRTLGAEIGPASFAYARTYFDGTATSVELEAPGAARSLSVYPNPAVRDQIVMVEGGRPGARFEVLDLLGRIVQRGQVNAGITRIDTGSVSSGLYLVRVADGLDIDTARLLITNGASR